jgi:hypothetical protein
MSASKSASSWNRYSSALKCLEQFAVVNNLTLTWPLSKPSLRNFVQWALHSRKLSPTTLTLYLSVIKTAHKLKDLDTENFSDFFVTSMLKGASNLALYNSISGRARLVMTLPLLNILGHEIANCTWSEMSKRVLWTACCVAFFGSFRMGELLAPDENKFSTETLTWDCVKFLSDSSAVIQLRYPKTGKTHFVDIFKIHDARVYPFSCLEALKKASHENVLKNLPVFTFEPGHYLSPQLFTTTLRSLLTPHIGANAKKFSGHSFRAAIPAAIANHPSLLSHDDVCK